MREKELHKYYSNKYLKKIKLNYNLNMSLIKNFSECLNSIPKLINLTVQSKLVIDDILHLLVKKYK